jgi:chemotaxis protein CheD
MRSAYLHAGELIVTAEPQWVSLVLGSCVAVTFFSRRPIFAAICHAVLPSRRFQASSPFAEPEGGAFRFVDGALEKMLSEVRRLSLPQVETKVFGGARLAMHHGGGAKLAAQVGDLNVAEALRILAEAQIEVKAEDTGGTQGRKILFNTVTGTVLLKRLR